MSAKPTTKKTARKPAAKPLQKRGTPGARGNLTREETTNLVLQAREAFDHQAKLGRVEPGTDFNDWRRDQVMDSVGVPGISKMLRSDWKQVKAHFLALAGDDEKAFELLNKTGVKSYRPVDGNDTWESSEAYVSQIRQALAGHATVAVSDPKGNIHAGWFLACARQRTRKPTLVMDSLAERLDPRTLHGLLSHLRNHIALREGRAVPELRKKRVYPKKADPGEMEQPF